MKTYGLKDLPPPAPKAIALGLFDGIHLGHQRVIRSAVENGLGLEAWVFTFSMERGHPSGKQPMGRLVTSSGRDSVLEGLGVKALFCPDFEEIREMSPDAFVEEILLRRLGASLVCCGNNFHFGNKAAGTPQVLAKLCEERGILLKVSPLLEAEGQLISSSRIRQAVQDGDMAAAGKMLGRRFFIDFEVVEGRKLGRTLNYPTINQPFPDDIVRPKFGVYATVVHLEGKKHAGVTNVGIKPTVGSDSLLAETYIRDFSGDLYGKKITVEFVEFLRPERKFESIEELRKQIQQDARKSFFMFSGQ